ncbi:MAG: NADH-quinone oxidoreductase subunit N [Candidatus Bathyarchaeota archaeon]|nr:NADH-quinone oxidoreductase subunit N [Candidatus Bathyarchaeota archaeon]MDH5745636.1 NADH-quinone oxidoreductase subunit N [Candidatus Bathyarchaeota archaeon]
MIEILDVSLPIISFVLFSLLTIPVVKAMRKRKGMKTVLTLGWFSTVFIIAAIPIANLAIKYYEHPSPQPFLNITLTSEPLAIFSSTFMIDAMSIYMAIIFTIVGAVTFLYSIFYINLSERPSERYYSVMLIIIGCIIGTAFSGDLLTLFIFWEASAAGSSFLMLYRKTPSSLHATLKYLVMIIIASAFIVYGLSIVYGITGTLNFWAVKQALIALEDKHLLVTAFIFIAAGYAIEAAVVPFHMWLPDAYTAAPASSSAFLSALIDQGSYYVLLRVLIYILTPPTVLEWTVMLAVFSALTMIVGNLLALAQENVKRLIANVCIADVGYNLVAITSVTPLGIMGNLYFFLIGGITTALSFMALGILNRMGFETLEDFSGVGRRMPFTSLALLLGVFSFAGVPPLAGFIAKYLVFTSAIEANLSWLAVIGVLTSIIQAAYLLRLINYMYAKTPQEETKIKEPKKLLVPIFILVAAIIILGVYPTIVLNLIEPVIQQLPFIP